MVHLMARSKWSTAKQAPRRCTTSTGSFIIGFGESGKFANIIRKLNAFLRTNVAAWHLGEKLQQFPRSECITKYLQNLSQNMSFLGLSFLFCKIKGWITCSKRGFYNFFLMRQTMTLLGGGDMVLSVKTSPRM